MEGEGQRKRYSHLQNRLHARVYLFHLSAPTHGPLWRALCYNKSSSDSLVPPIRKLVVVHCIPPVRFITYLASSLVTNSTRDVEGLQKRQQMFDKATGPIELSAVRGPYLIP